MRNESLLTIKELSEYTKLKVSYLYKLVHLGKISGYKAFGKRLMFDRTEIDLILKSNKTYSAQETELEANTYSLLKN